MIAIAHTLNKLATDSEIICDERGRLSPLRLFRPFLYANRCGGVLFAFIASYLAPMACAAQAVGAVITADVLANICMPAALPARSRTDIRFRAATRRLLVGISSMTAVIQRNAISIVADHGTS